MAAMDLFSALITGANRGIGLEFTRQLLQLEKPPKYVFATYRSPDDIQELETLRDTSPDGTAVHLIKMDVREIKEIEDTKAIIEDLVGENGLTLLINNAGVNTGYKPFLGATAEDLNLHFSVNAVGPFVVAQVMYPLLKKATSRKSTPGMSFSKAAILNISTMCGSIANAGVELISDLNYPGYKISKAALNMGMRIMAAKVKHENILAISMCPGWVKTDMGSKYAELQPQDSIAAMLNTISKLNEDHHGTYMDRFGKPIPW